jgi:hypothetical protein
MEKGAPYEGRFAKKQGRSPPHWSFARTGFVLAVCIPLAIAPVPAAAQYYSGDTGRGGHGFGVGGGIGAGIVGGLILGEVLHHLNNKPPGYPTPTHRTRGTLPPRVYVPGPEHSPRHPPRYVPPPVEPVRYSKPPKNEPAPPPPTRHGSSPRRHRRLRPVPPAAFPPKTSIATFRTRSYSNLARAFRRKRSMRSRGGSGCNGSRHNPSS